MKLYLLTNGGDRKYIDEFSSIDDLRDWLLQYFKDNKMIFYTKCISIIDTIVRITYDIDNDEIPDIIFEVECYPLYLHDFKEGWL